MRKTLTISLFVFLVYIMIRFLFSYTIINIPYVFGTETYVGGSKHDFPICVTNPIKMNSIKERIITFHKNSKGERGAINERSVCWLFGETEKPSDFEVISVNTGSSDENSFLLQSKKDNAKRCVAFFDKESGRVLRFEF